jgi:hypothetical protein
MASLLLAHSALGTTLVNETFEGTGTPSGWSSGTGADFDYTGLVLSGTQSLRANSAGSTVTANVNLGAGYDEIWTKWLVRVVTCPTNSRIFFFYDPSFSEGGVALFIFSDSTATVDFGTYQTFNIGTTYYMWTHFHKNATSDIWWNTVDDRSTATHVTETANNLQAQYLVMGAANSMDIVFDNVQVADTDAFGGATPTPTAAPSSSPSNRFFLFPQ